MKKWTLIKKNETASLWLNNKTQRYSIWSESTLLEYLTYSSEKEAAQYFSTFKFDLAETFPQYNFEEIRDKKL